MYTLTHNLPVFHCELKKEQIHFRFFALTIAFVALYFLQNYEYKVI
uniref:Uncharacterized protein n=1 Tax=Anguilla anguilla TaxID=7936 RepID=A0A0E9R2X1_ANGAN